MVYEETTTPCKNLNPSINSLYSSRYYDEYIYACYGNNRYSNVIKLDSNFEVERIINNYQYTINTCDHSTFSITKSLNDDNNYIIILTCSYNSYVIYEDLPEGFI